MGDKASIIAGSAPGLEPLPARRGPGAVPSGERPVASWSSPRAFAGLAGPVPAASLRHRGGRYGPGGTRRSSSALDHRRGAQFPHGRRAHALGRAAAAPGVLTGRQGGAGRRMDRGSRRARRPGLRQRLRLGRRGAADEAALLEAGGPGRALRRALHGDAAADERRQRPRSQHAAHVGAAAAVDDPRRLRPSTSTPASPSTTRSCAPTSSGTSWPTAWPWCIPSAPRRSWPR